MPPADVPPHIFYRYSTQIYKHHPHMPPAESDCFEFEQNVSKFKPSTSEIWAADHLWLPTASGFCEFEPRTSVGWTDDAWTFNWNDLQNRHPFRKWARPPLAIDSMTFKTSVNIETNKFKLWLTTLNFWSKKVKAGNIQSGTQYALVTSQMHRNYYFLCVMSIWSTATICICF